MHILILDDVEECKQ